MAWAAFNAESIEPVGDALYSHVPPTPPTCSRTMPSSSKTRAGLRVPSAGSRTNELDTLITPPPALEKSDSMGEGAKTHGAVGLKVPVRRRQADGSDGSTLAWYKLCVLWTGTVDSALNRLMWPHALGRRY